MLLSKPRNVFMAIALLLTTACASTPSAVTDYDPGFDFSGVRSIAIMPLNRDVSSVADVSDIQAARMNETMGNELTRRGYKVVEDPANADMLMTWHLVTQERTDVRTYNSMSARYSSCWSCPRGVGGSTSNVRVTQFTQGTLIADMLDPARMQSVWRSVVESRLRDLDPQQAEDKRRAVAEALFKDFPPR